MRPFIGAVGTIAADAEDINVLVLSDSTAEADTEWVYLWASEDLAGYTTYTVNYERWEYSGTPAWETEETLSTGSGSNAIKVWNASGGGYGCTAFTSRESEIIQHPSAVDYVVISLGHNASRSYADFAALVDMLQSNWPSAYVTMVKQNPRYDDYELGETTWATVQAIADDYSLGVVDVGAAFLADDDPETNLMSDDVHPNAAGTAVYQSTVNAAFSGSGDVVTIAGKTPELLAQAKNYGGSGDWLDESGNGHNLSISGATFASFDGTVSLRSNTAETNFCRTVSTNLAALSTGDLDVRIKVRLSDLTPGTYSTLVGNYQSDSLRVFRFDLNTNGRPRLYTTPDGTFGNSVTADATAAVPASLEGEAVWLRAVRDVDNGASGNDTYFYYSTDGGSWTQIGATVTNSGTTSIKTWAGSYLEIFRGSAGRPDGHFYELEIYSEGVLKVALTTAGMAVGDTTLTDSVNSASFTCTGTVIERTVFILTTDDYMEVADDASLDFAADESFTVIAVATPSTIAAGSDVLVAKKDDLTTAAGWALVRNAANVQIIVADGTADDDDTRGSLTASTRAVFAGVRDVSGDDIEAFLDGAGSGSATTDSTTATLANALPLRVGATSGTAANFWEGTVETVALFREALTDTEVLQVGAALTATGGRSWSHVASMGQELT